VLVLTELTITPPDGSKHDVTLRFVYHMDGAEPEAPETEVPGHPGAFMRVMAVSPSDGAVALRLRGISKDPAAEHQAATRESLSIEITRKPLINLVWGGFYVMMAGGILAFLKRAREARRAVILPETTRDQPSALPSAPPAALPVSARSQLPTGA
jgi:hypothetical protein